MRGFSGGYQLNPTPEGLAAGNLFYQDLWAKEGYGGPLGLNKPCLDYQNAPHGHCYMVDMDTIANGGYGIGNGTLDGSNRALVKWFGYFWGYGFGFSWPAARLNGVVDNGHTGK